MLCRLTVALLFAGVLGAQQPITIGGDRTAGSIPGLVKFFDWYGATPSGCTAGAGWCVGHALQGDTYYWTAWLPNASGLPVTGGLPIVGTSNDSDLSPTCGDGNIHVLQLDTWSWTTPRASHVTAVNCMTGYGSNTTSTGWTGQLTSGDGRTDGTWKSRLPFSKGGILYLPVERQVAAGPASIHDATMLMSPDSGVHWCNPFTFMNHATSPGCDSSNWSATGDQPQCGAASSGLACTNSGYTDGSHSSIMWKALPLGTENWSAINYAYQDGGTAPTGINDGCDPSAFTCFILTPGTATIARVAVADNILDISKWRYYACPTITQNYRCDGSDSANWTATFANRTPVISSVYPVSQYDANFADPYGVTYIKEFGSYIMPGRGDGNIPSYSWAPRIQGPWATVYWTQSGNPVPGHFLTIAPALGYTVVGTSPPHVQVTTVSNSYEGGQGSPKYAMWDLVVGGQSQGEAYRSKNTSRFTAGSSFRFSDSKLPGSLPKKGIVWSFDFLDQGANSGLTSWPYFLDRGTNSAVMVPCDGTSYTALFNCGFMNSGHGTDMNNNGPIVTDTSEQYFGRLQSFKGEVNGYSSASPTFGSWGSQNAPSVMQGNGSYTVIGVYKYTASAPFNRVGGIWSTGVSTSGDNTAVSMDTVNGAVQLNWNSANQPHYQFLSTWTFPDVTNYYFVAATVQAQGGGCTTACVPTAHLWVATNGHLADYLSGVSYTNTPSHNASTQTPNVSAAPFVLGLNSGGSGTSTQFATVMVYDHALGFQEIQQEYNGLKTNLITRGVLLEPLGAASAGTTDTQGVITYNAPNSSDCTVAVSESASYTPLVPDVDSTLFTGAGISSGAAGPRIFVIGKRTIETALDSNNYSRALQNTTTHYWRLTCGSSVGTGTFTTKNIPFQMTYHDIPQLDGPGATKHVTMDSNNRNQTIVDPHTGALIKRVSIPDDTGWYPGAPNNHASAFMYFGGSTKICDNNLTGPGPGYVCSFPAGDGGQGVMYYIIPSTGEVRFLGCCSLGPYPYIDPVTGKFYGFYADTLYVQTYTGSYAAVPPGTTFPISTTNITVGVLAAIHAFDSNFDVTAFNCGVDQFEGIYAIFTCGRGQQQDGYGWYAVINVNTGLVIAAMQMYQNGNYHWTGQHHTDALYDAAGGIFTTHSLVGSTTGPQLGLGPYVSTYTGGSTLSIGSTSIAVDGEPQCSNPSGGPPPTCSPDANLPIAQNNDRYTFLDSSNEIVTLVNKVSPTSWTISPTTSTHAPGVQLRAEGTYTQFVWKFLIDPHGTDTTGTGIVQEMAINGHDDIVHDLLLMEGYYVRVGNLLTMAGQPWTLNIDSSPTFAGVLGQCYGNGCAAHPSGAAAQPWLTDELRWDGAYQVGGTITPITGQLYQFSGVTQSIKQLPQSAAVGAVWYSGPFALQDVSGPGVTLGTTSADNYKYCVANAANECHSGSSAGDVFFNMPGTVGSTCGSFFGPCINNFAAWAAVFQMGVDGVHTRVITDGLEGLSEMGGTPVAKATAGGEWLLFNTGDVQHVPPGYLLMAKLPPFVVEDSVDRTTFVRAPISISTPAGLGIATATVEFGYYEQGAISNHYCTSRRETCVAVAATVTDATPFSYKTTDTYTKASCAASCTITLPVFPMHTAYYQVKFYDGSGVFVQNGPSGVAVESTVKVIP